MGIVLAAKHPAVVRSLISINAPTVALASSERVQMHALAAALRFIGPTCFVTGSSDRFWSAARATMAAAAVPAARVETIDCACHLAPRESPEATSAFITGFWAKVGATA